MMCITLAAMNGSGGNKSVLKAQIKNIAGLSWIFTGRNFCRIPQGFCMAGAREVHCLAWDFEMDLRLICHELEAVHSIKIKLIPIPREIMEKNRILWGKRSICSVANLTRRDGEEFPELAPKMPVRTEVETFPLAEANETLARLQGGRIRWP